MAYTPSCMHMALLQALSILVLASMLVPGHGSAEEAPSVYRIELIHVDANGGFTREELINRAVDRAHLRESILSTTDGTNSPASSGTYSVAAVHRDYEYLMKLEIGTSPEPIFAVADTGSDLVWTKQLKPCSRSSSSTFTHVNCSKTPDGLSKCKGCPVGAMSNTCYEGLCMFKKEYGRGHKTAKGFMGNETLTLSGKTTDKTITFGCAIDIDDGLMPKFADGIVGLNRGPMSLVTQLKITKFSYCLSNQLEPELSSSLWIGGDDLGLSDIAGGAGGSKLQSTPLVQLQMPSNRYHVELDGISIDSERRSLEKLDIKHKSKSGKGVMFIDSGCTRTNLEKPVFSVLKDLLAVKLGKSNSTTKNDKVHTCFPSASNKPKMVLHFNGANMDIPWESYIFQLESEFCLAINETEGTSVLGNFQQQNIYMLYDLTDKKNEKLSFVQDFDCRKHACTIRT